MTHSSVIRLEDPMLVVCIDVWVRTVMVADTGVLFLETMASTIVAMVYISSCSSYSDKFATIQKVAWPTKYDPLLNNKPTQIVQARPPDKRVVRYRSYSALRRRYNCDFLFSE